VALASGRDGNAGIELPDAMLLEEKLWRGSDVADIRNELTWLIERRNQAISLEKKAMIDAQGEQNKELEQKQQQAVMAGHKMKMQEITVSEGEKRKTVRLQANNAFLQSLVEQSNKEQAEGGITDATFDRMRMAMNVAARVGDLSQVDLQAEVGKLEQGMAMNPRPNTMPV
jgi:hypothetical protein